MKYTKATYISMKSHDTLDEKWLQERLVEDPGLLGLGDLDVKAVERPQPGAGRLDLLLADPEADKRYEVEIQLGATNEAHIIRTVEYWDIEKSRYPQYEHVAVLVAEAVTSRFLNVISLFNKAIPLIAIQMQAIEVGKELTLVATTVLDLMPLGPAEDEAGQATDRPYWLKKGSKATVEMADALLAIINEIADDKLALNYNKHYIGLARDGLADNFVQFRPRRKHLIVNFRIPRSDEVSGMIEEAGIDDLPYETRWNQYRLRITPPEINEQRDLLSDLIRRASDTPTKDV